MQAPADRLHATTGCLDQGIPGSASDTPLSITSHLIVRLIVVLDCTMRRKGPQGCGLFYLKVHKETK
jgi:hypothetical protein